MGSRYHYVPTHAGFLYLSVVIDAFSRRVVGWSMANHLRSELVEDFALDMALGQRRPDGVIHHFRPGITVHFRGLWQAMQTGWRSMGSVGDCYDNALCESFFASLECELLDRRRFAKNRRQTCPVSIHRGLLQYPETTLFPRISLTRKLRKELKKTA